LAALVHKAHREERKRTELERREEPKTADLHCPKGDAEEQAQHGKRKNKKRKGGAQAKGIVARTLVTPAR
jgi:hypothetical protein